MTVDAAQKRANEFYLGREQVESLLAQNSLAAELVVRAETSRMGAAGRGAVLVFLLLGQRGEALM